MNPALDWSLPAWRASMVEISKAAVAQGLTLLLYEGGTHAQLTGTLGSATTRAAVLQHHLSASQTANYEYLWKVWKDDVASGGCFSLYADVGGWDVNGLWTLAQTYNLPLTPAIARIQNLAEVAAPWWSTPVIVQADTVDDILRRSVGIYDTVLVIGNAKNGELIWTKSDYVSGLTPGNDQGQTEDTYYADPGKLRIAIETATRVLFKELMATIGNN